jgi:uncharacterized OsmC-like protein
LKISLDVDLTDDQKREFLKEIEERCPVADNIENGGLVNLELA